MGNVGLDYHTYQLHESQGWGRLGQAREQYPMAKVKMDDGLCRARSEQPLVHARYMGTRPGWGAKGCSGWVVVPSGETERCNGGGDLGLIMTAGSLDMDVDWVWGMSHWARLWYPLLLVRARVVTGQAKLVSAPAEPHESYVWVWTRHGWL